MADDLGVDSHRSDQDAAVTADRGQPALAFDSFTARLIRREALRRAALELSTATPAGLESALSRISAEVTAEALDARTIPQ